jgi:dTDP-4-dehydrorhamnose 3,5-epimerase
MIKGVMAKKINRYEDPRGWLVELFRNDETDYRPAMAYASMTKPGVSRGPHEHVRQTDFFIFPGPGDFKVYLWDVRESSETKGEYVSFDVGSKNPSIVVVPPGVVHGYKCISDENGLCINLADKLYKGEDKKEEADEIRWEQKEDSPYKIE